MWEKYFSFFFPYRLDIIIIINPNPKKLIGASGKTWLTSIIYVHPPMTSWALNALALGNNDVQIILDGFLCVSIILSGQRAQGATVFNKAKEKE